MLARIKIVVVAVRASPTEDRTGPIVPPRRALIVTLALSMGRLHLSEPRRQPRTEEQRQAVGGTSGNGIAHNAGAQRFVLGRQEH